MTNVKFVFIEIVDRMLNRQYRNNLLVRYARNVNECLLARFSHKRTYRWEYRKALLQVVLIRGGEAVADKQ